MRRGALSPLRPPRLDGLSSLGRLRWPPHPPDAGGSPRRPPLVAGSERSGVLRFAARYGSSDSLRKASPAHACIRDERGLTLIELIVVIIVLSLLVGLVGPRLFGRVSQSKQAVARAQIELLGAGLDQYRLDIGSYPTTAQGLEALVRNPGVSSWNGPYLKKPAIPKDPWGNSYHYKCCPGEHGDYDLWSYGSDNAPGGEGESADATSWTVK